MKKIYKVTQAQLATLQNGGSITVGDTTYTYETGSDVAYVIVDPSHPEYALTQTDNKLQFRKNGTVADSLTVDFSKASSYATKARNLEYDERETGVGTETLHFNLYTGGTVKGLTTFKGGLKSEQEPTEDTDVANKAYVKKVFDDAYPTGALATVATSGSYNDLKDKPTIPAAVTVDSALSDSSTNPVQNKIIKAALDGKQAAGSYAAASHTHTKSQITDFPTIPTKTSELTNDSRFAKTSDLPSSGSPSDTLTGGSGTSLGGGWFRIGSFVAVFFMYSVLSLGSTTKVTLSGMPIGSASNTLLYAHSAGRGEANILDYVTLSASGAVVSFTKTSGSYTNLSTIIIYKING